MIKNQLSLVETLEEVIENIKTFNKELKDSPQLIKKLTNFKHWYYSRELNMFAPSMFIGYKNNSAVNYERGTSGAEKYMSGWDTEDILHRWSIDSEGLDFLDLKDELRPLFEAYNKKFRNNMHIHILYSKSK